MLLRYDSTQGRFPGEVLAEGGHLLVDGRKIQVLSERAPGRPPLGRPRCTVVSSRLVVSPNARSRGSSEGGERSGSSYGSCDLVST